ncbi:MULTISPECIES: 2-oxo acid dehydrogenase subunit E2 [Clostridium]|uniref:2-oxo acid dehydrogenase subunit E2 n=1 Tax=Clostridium cibarium TaxID=2762247 RepID=A0ABR8PUR1_9CLOT|nr:MULTISPECIES: 2-oxo acid dehydrogenase subunit E2 [Clostridium]MBD7911910.1 2-oxo acid dehydrogenase subunit E2 [Clostridium cibarium]
MNYKNIKIKATKKFDLQRKVVSHMTSTSWKTVPHVTYIYEPDITNFYEEFLKLSKNKIKSNHKITFNTIMIKTIIEGLLLAPDLNSYVEYNSKKSEGTLYILDAINIAIPWLLPDEKMITPTILNTEKMSLNDISNSILSLSKKIKNTNINEMLYKAACTDTINEIRKLNFSILGRILSSKFSQHKASCLKGLEKQNYYNIPEKDRLTEKNILSATVTVSNIGSLYKEQKGFFSLLEIIPPQVFAIGISSIQEKAGIFTKENGIKEIGIRKTLPMCLAFDHRALDFNSIIPFIKTLDKIFTKPNIIHRW